MRTNEQRQTPPHDIICDPVCRAQPRPPESECWECGHLLSSTLQILCPGAVLCETCRPRVSAQAQRMAAGEAGA